MQHILLLLMFRDCHYLSMDGIKNIPLDHDLLSLAKPHDANCRSSERIVYPSHTLVMNSYVFQPQLRNALAE